MTAGKYATGTEVSSDRSRAEIERTLARYGANSFMYGWTEHGAVVGFTMHNRQIRFVIPLPDRKAAEFTKTPQGRVRSAAQVTAQYEQAVRQKWRALALVVKAKLEAVEAGIVDFETEFAVHMVLPGGHTVADHLLPAIDEAYDTGRVPPLLPSWDRPVPLALPPGRKS